MSLFNLLYQDVYSSGYDKISMLTVVTQVIFVILIVVFVMCILTIIGQWQLFKKAGKPGWAALIPIYNTYVLCQITGVNPWWIAIVFVAGVIIEIVPALSIVSTIVEIYFGVLLAVSVSRSFGKNDGYAVGIYFLGFIFYPILGFGKSEYLGPTPMNDLIFKKDNVTNTTFTTPEANVKEDNNSSQNVHYCPSCGTQLTIDTKYCPHCGREL